MSRRALCCLSTINCLHAATGGWSPSFSLYPKVMKKEKPADSNLTSKLTPFLAINSTVLLVRCKLMMQQVKRLTKPPLFPLCFTGICLDSSHPLGLRAVLCFYPI